VTRLELAIFSLIALGLLIFHGLSAVKSDAQQPAPVSLRLRGRSLSVSAPIRDSPLQDPAHRDLTVMLSNASSRSFSVSPSDFTLSVQGDTFGVQRWNAGTAPVPIAPRHSDVIRLAFSAPRIAGQATTLVYRPADTSITGVVPLNASSPRPLSTASRARVAVGTFPVSRGAGDPWGTAFDRWGNLWFAEPGCDFAPTCPAGTPPGQIGELKASSHAVALHPLPNIPGNQPIFLAFDSAGNLWFTTPDNSKIGEFRPSTRKFIGQWGVTAGSGPWDLTFSNRTIWYTEHLVSAVGRFNPITHRHHDFQTPSANSDPYGIAAAGPLIWFTENDSDVDRVAVLDTRKHNDPISEYPIVRPLSGTPHMIAIGADGHPWWTEGFSNTIATLDPAAAKPGRCGRRLGVCKGIRRFALPPSTSCSTSAHASGIAFERSRGVVWLDNSLTAQVGSFNPRRDRFTLRTLSDCDDHPHDGLNLDSAGNVWFDMEFDNAIGELIP